MIYFTSDTHFSHARIIEYCDRPFASVEAMDTALVANWNACVKPNDHVIHVGDVTLLRKPQKDKFGTLNVLRSLNGHKIVVAGNHDETPMRCWLREQGWVVIHSILVEDVLIQHNPHIFFKHELPEGINNVIHGHTHGTWSAPKYFDVGIDPLKYVPIAAKDLWQKLELSPESYAALNIFCKALRQ